MQGTRTLKDAVDAYGRPRFTQVIGETKQAVWNWIERGSVPESKAPNIEKLTGIAVEVLCSGSPWGRIKDDSWPHPGGRPVIDHGKAKQTAKTSRKKAEA